MTSYMVKFTAKVTTDSLAIPGNKFCAYQTRKLKSQDEACPFPALLFSLLKEMLIFMSFF